MATVTPPSGPASPSPRLDDWQRRVRHPLERLRGILRTYVGLEGLALLVTLLALWFWAGLAWDFGFFKLFRLDWVQEVPRPVRSLLLGLIFLGVVFVARMGLILGVIEEDARIILRTAFASGGRRQALPVWLRLPAVAMAAGVFGWLGSLLGSKLGEGWAGLLGSLAAGGAGCAVTVLHEALVVRGRSALPWWLRTLAAGVGSLVGGWFGHQVGYGVAEGLGGAVGAALAAPLGDLAALMLTAINYLLVKGRAYVVPLALPAILGYLALWYLLGAAADRGLGSVACALGVALLIVGPVLFVMLKRLLYDFRPQALALLLERRFPKQLGDRLITAVELADPRQGESYGYSPAMIEQTIHEAAERVEQVPVKDVFDWGRLRRMGMLVAFLTLGLYLLAGTAFFLYAQYRGRPGGFVGGFSSLHEAASLWAERNVGLRNTIWPRQAHLEVLDWPVSGEIRVGKDAASPSVRVRAYKWVVADRSSPEGWRPLAWNDLVGRPKLLGQPVPPDAVPADWGAPRDPALGWTLDEIELRLDRRDIHDKLPPETQKTLRDVFATLEARAADPALRRTLRQLTVPATVTVVHRGATGGGEMTLQRQGDNEYTGQFDSLRENVRFTVRGEDYSTRTLNITVVPTPSLVKLTVDEHRPAYIYYRVQGGPADVLKGKKQLVAGRQVSLYGGDTSRIDPVPAGTDLVLHATADKDLVKVTIPPPRKGVAEVKAEPKLLNPREFEVRFDAVRATPERPVYDFSFEFVDTDGVTGRRHIVIRPVEDAVPEVDVSAEVVRKTPQGWMVTPLARIPVRMKVNDDFGLDAVDWACTVSRIDRGSDQGGKAMLLLAAMHLAAGGPGQELAAAARMATAARETKSPDKPDAAVQRFPVVPFAQMLKEQRQEYLPAEQILARLGERPPEGTLTKFFELIGSEKDPLREADWFFPVERLNLKADESREIQPRYRMQLWVEAVDNDVETGPHRGPSKEKLTVLVVSENELLTEIAKEEESLYVKLADRVKSLQDGRGKLDRVKEDLTSAALKPEQISGMAVRAEELGQLLEKGESIVGEVMTDYQRILRELITNRVQQPMIDRVEKQVCLPLEEATTRHFPRAREGMAELRKALESAEPDVAAKAAKSRQAADEARARMETLIAHLTGVLDKMQQLADINVLIKMIREIEEEEVRQETVLKKLKKQLEESFLDQLTNPGGKKS